MKDFFALKQENIFQFIYQQFCLQIGIKTTSGIDKKRIESDPAFKRTRENMAEFGGSAKVGKSLRLGFASVIPIQHQNTL